MKKTIYSNHRVEVWPDDYWISSSKGSQEYHRKMISRLESLKSDIKRHIDDVSSMNYEYDTEVVCEFCGYTWEKEWDEEEPNCCQKAIDEFNAKVKPE